MCQAAKDMCRSGLNAAEAITSLSAPGIKLIKDDTDMDFLPFLMIK